VREVGDQPFTNCTDGVTGGMYQQTLTRFTFTEADGTQHDFVDAQTGGSYFSSSPIDVSTPFQTAYQCNAAATQSRGVVWVSRDDTFSTLILDSDVTDGTSYNGGGTPYPIFSGGTSASRGARLYAKDGTLYQFNSQGYLASVRDRNGNTVTYTYAMDTNQMNSYGKVIGITDSLGRQITITYAPFPTPGVNDVYDTSHLPRIER
jgi:YD repeat-containing protein